MLPIQYQPQHFMWFHYMWAVWVSPVDIRASWCNLHSVLIRPLICCARAFCVWPLVTCIHYWMCGYSCVVHVHVLVTSCHMRTCWTCEFVFMSSPLLLYIWHIFTSFQYCTVDMCVVLTMLDTCMQRFVKHMEDCSRGITMSPLSRVTLKGHSFSCLQYVSGVTWQRCDMCFRYITV